MMKLTLEVDCSSEDLQWLKSEITDLCNEELGGPPVFQQWDVSGSLSLVELGCFVDWIRDLNFKQYADGWCEAGGSNGWHCTTDELLKMFRDRQ